MATYKTRGVHSHSVIYWYNLPDGKPKQQWETYQTELEAVQRKAHIDYLEKKKLKDDLYKAAMEYKARREQEQAKLEALKPKVDIPEQLIPATEDNTNKTYGEFIEKWRPYHAKDKLISPNTFENYRSNLDNHISPFFGNKKVSSITAEDIANFLTHLRKKPVKGSKSFRKNPSEIPTLSSSSIRKCYNTLIISLKKAEEWGYIERMPKTEGPSVKYKKRKHWDSRDIFNALQNMKDDKLLHLAVHITFICSLRAGETAGIEIKTIDLYARNFQINQEIQRATDEALEIIPKEEIFYVFPKDNANSKSSIIAKDPKTEESTRKLFLTTPLLQEIKERLEIIEKNKAFFGNDYYDYGLLICKPDGRPFDPKDFCKWFKKWQSSKGIADQIDFQGLRKSGQMHKIRLGESNQRHHELVAKNAGHSIEVMRNHYDEVLDDDKRRLSLLVETNFYPQSENSIAKNSTENNIDIDSTLKAMQENPEFAKQILQLLLSNAANVTQ
jgi:integrase